MTPTYQIAAYFPEWEVRRPYYLKTLETTGSAAKITILNYAFGRPEPDPVTGTVVCQFRDPAAAYTQVYTAEMSIDGQADDPAQPLRGHFNQLLKLKQRHPQIKVVLSIGGWDDSAWFSDAARTPESRAAFVTSCIQTYILGDLPERDGAGGPGSGAGVFDGIDIDWEYPLADGLPTNHYHPRDDENFVLLLAEFRRQYAALGRPDLLLTAAVPGPAQARQFRMPEAHAYLDWVALMTYDLVNGYSPMTGHHTGLHNSAFDPAPEAEKRSAEATVHLYRDLLGVPAEKLLLGAAFYGRGWGGVPSAQNGLHQPGTVLPDGYANYRDLIRRIGPAGSQPGLTRHWDAPAGAPWLYDAEKQIFWTYDDPQSLALKAAFIREQGLAGVMFWEISADDDQGALLDALYRGLENG